MLAFCEICSCSAVSYNAVSCEARGGVVGWKFWWIQARGGRLDLARPAVSECTYTVTSAAALRGKSLAGSTTCFQAQCYVMKRLQPPPNPITLERRVPSPTRVLSSVLFLMFLTWKTLTKYTVGSPRVSLDSCELYSLVTFLYARFSVIFSHPVLGLCL